MATVKTKVYVFPVPGRAADVSQAHKTIKSAGCEVICASDDSDEYGSCVKSADTVVILICSQTMDDKVIAPVVELAAALGKHIVGVWAADAQQGKHPPSLHKYGSATVRMDVDEFATAVCGRDSVWITPDGKKQPTPKTPRHNQ